MSISVALSGDSIINRHISMCDNDQFKDLIELFRSSDIGFTHLETVLTNYEDEEVYPAAEAGGTWMRSPPSIADELAWAGFNMISHASNHALDYGYGGLRNTWTALEEAGVSYAGTGRTLGDARSPTYVDTSNGRVGLVSMTSTFTPWSRAGETRFDMRGRPGVNPVRIFYKVDSDTMDSIKDLARKFGWWITQEDDEILINRHGLHNTAQKYIESNSADGATMVLNENDVNENCRAISDAALRSDIAIAHLHTHEFDSENGMEVPPECMKIFARQCADSGADIVIFQGSHAPIRGIEIYEGTPIFYDPGDFFFQSDSVERLPSEFYHQHQYNLSTHVFESRPSEGFSARGLVYPWGSSSMGSDNSATFGTEESLLHPSEGMFIGPGCLVPVCTFENRSLKKIQIYPATWLEEPKSLIGIPKAAVKDEAVEILEYLKDLSAPYGTSITIEDNIGIITV